MKDKKIKQQQKQNYSKEEIEQLKKEVEEWKNKYLRALADYQNLEKRFIDEKNNIIESANFQLIVKLLPFLDSLEKAEVFVKDNGLKIVKDNLLKVFQEVGLKEIEILNKEFDPNLAEAVDLVSGERDNIVVGVSRKGYIIGNKIIRVAQVKVSKRISNS